MQLFQEVVKDSSGGAWEFNMPLPETIEEAIEIYGQDGAMSLLIGHLKLRLQGIARNNFREGKSREEVEELVREYRPGKTARKSKKQVATELIVQHATELASDPTLKEQVTEALAKNKYQDVIDLLGG